MAAVTAGLITAGVAAYGAYNANKQAKEAEESAVARDPASELEANFDAEARLLPRRLELQREFQPQFDDMNLGRLEKISPRINEIGRSADPNFYGLRDSMLTSAREGIESGGALSERELADVRAESRGAYSARGLALNKSSALGELMDTESARRRRLGEDRQFALGAAGVGAGTIIDPYQIGLGMLPNVGDQLDPKSGYFEDAYNTNLNAAESRANAARNRQAALYGAGINALGRVAENWG